ncbi:hypothetical protein LMG29542_08392 [Paraburkholderia humisilvae]|uniref:Uncharacterized protein n=1 Tax=Paraburkholderia humisilvae TaxID=627669 RepID=A0A6J5F844_9BURK|nr:hypothetical protein LMG29542_08392 [Paraburkholderia humisilvae]
MYLPGAEEHEKASCSGRLTSGPDGSDETSADNIELMRLFYQAYPTGEISESAVRKSGARAVAANPNRRFGNSRSRSWPSVSRSPGPTTFG